MNKVTEFINKWGLLILFIFLLIGGCVRNNSERKKETLIKKSFDSLENKISELESKLIKEIKIEGLKSEKRMIQASDRKIMDLNRQIEIDKELKTLE